MKIQTSELTGAALDWAVATALGMSWWSRRAAKWDTNLGYTDWIIDHDGKLKKFMFDGSSSRAGHWCPHEIFEPSTDWSQGGPIIERENISPSWIIPTYQHRHLKGCWSAYIPGGNGKTFYAPTPLIAVMRCFVANKLGDEVDVPEELLT